MYPEKTFDLNVYSGFFIEKVIQMLKKRFLHILH